MENEIFTSPKKKGKISVLISGRGSNFKAIHDSILAGKINAEIVLVFSNKKDAPGLQIARERGLKTLFLDPKDFSSREEYDQRVVEELKKREVDLICLAGYMRILTPYFVNQFKNRIMNIHPALLPSFPGLHVQKKALDWGVKFSGATVHFVTEEVDAGPIIIQAVVPVFQYDTEDTLSARILEQEHKIYSEAVRLFFEGKLEVRGRKVYIRE
ncbi:MAG: phosphoribosylglycinamide formyltransferase [Candidatus Aminicenantia bacterium]